MLVLGEGMRTTKFPRSTFNESFPWCSIDFHRKTTDGPGENCLGESDLPSIRGPQDFPKFDGPHHSPRLDSAGTAGFTQPATCRSCSLRNHRLNGWTYINADLIYWSVISVSVPVHGQSSHLHGFPSVVSGSHRNRWTGPRWLWQLAKLYLQNVTRAREQIFASTSAYQYNLNRRPLGHFWEICLKVVSVVIAIWYPLTCYFVYGIPVIPIHWSAKGLKHVYPSLKTCNIPV